MYASYKEIKTGTESETMQLQLTACGMESDI